MPSEAPSSAPSEAPSEAWSRDDLASNPHARQDKDRRVRAMFASIAGKYDLANRVHSLWRDQAWRRFAVRQAAPTPTDDVLDVACGTGDLTEAFALAGARRVVGLDFTAEMLDVARVKIRRPRLARVASRVEYTQGDAQNLPYADASFDIVSIAFGIRNVLEPARAIREFRRVLRPGGRLVILEFAEPTFPPVRWFNTLYCQRIMPHTATWLTGDRSGAYRYLPKSVATFLPPAQMSRLLEDAGFAPPTISPLTLGICVCYRTQIPA